MLQKTFLLFYFMLFHVRITDKQTNKLPALQVADVFIQQ